MSSGCSLCAATGQCATAYKNSPGQFCGSFYDMNTSFNKPCCCPLNSVCNMSPTQCMCHVQGHQANNFHRGNNYAPPSYHAPSYNNPTYRQYETNGSGFIIFILIVICCCCVCCRRGTVESQNHHYHDKHTPMATAFPVESCPIAPPSNNPVYHGYGTQGHMGSGAGTAVASGLGGLAAGTIIGDMFSRNRAGYNISGDSGGYNIVGDSDADGGGFDIQGDS